MKSDLVGMFSHPLNVDGTFCDLKICLQGTQSLTMKGMQSKSLLWKNNRESHLYCMFSRKQMLLNKFRKMLPVGLTFNDSCIKEKKTKNGFAKV